MPKLIVNGPAGSTEVNRLIVIPLIAPQPEWFAKQGEALAKFVGTSVYSGTYDEMMKSLIATELRDYENRNNDPEAKEVAKALAVFHKRLCARCDSAANGPDGATDTQLA